MDKQAVLERLKTIIHPKLDKNIVELKLIDTLEIKTKSLHVKINTDNKEAFNFFARAIPKLFKDDFRDIEVEKNIKETKKVIAISSGKGGVGKSTVSANFAVALAQVGYKVGLLDADVYGPSIPSLFGIEDEKIQRNDQNKIIPYENLGVKVISVSLVKPSSNITEFLKDAEWGELDFLIIDMPSGVIQQSIAEELPLFGAILVTTPQTLACDALKHAVMMFRDAHVKILGVVENMSYFIAPDTNKRYDIFGKNGGKKICEKYGLPLLSQVPLDMKIREMSDEGKMPIVLGNENIKESYKKIVKKILEEV